MNITNEAGDLVVWTGIGIYVAEKVKGPKKFVRLPKGKEPADNSITIDYNKKPNSYSSSPRSDRPWK